MKYSTTRLLCLVAILSYWLFCAKECRTALANATNPVFDAQKSRIIDTPVFDPHGVPVIAAAAACGALVVAVTALGVFGAWALAIELEGIFVPNSVDKGTESDENSEEEVID